MSTIDPMPSLSESEQDDLRRVAAQLESEEESNRKAHLSSVESFRAWLQANPIFRSSPTLMELFAQYGPALLQFFQRLVT